MVVRGVIATGHETTTDIDVDILILLLLHRQTIWAAICR
jgi:hypothetical protein